MTHAALALQEAMYNAMMASDGLVASLGGQQIYDDVPAKKHPPYIVFGAATHSDWSAGDDEGLEHFITINVWSKQNGRKQALEIAEAVTQSFRDLPKALTDHCLVNFTHEFTEVTHEQETGFFLAQLNFRAVTEPAQS